MIFHDRFCDHPPRLFLSKPVPYYALIRAVYKCCSVYLKRVMFDREFVILNESMSVFDKTGELRLLSLIGINNEFGGRNICINQPGMKLVALPSTVFPPTCSVEG
jgi:hypothetical protein